MVNSLVTGKAAESGLETSLVSVSMLDIKIIHHDKRESFTPHEAFDRFCCCGRQRHGGIIIAE